jgi:hypothetical protein
MMLMLKNKNIYKLNILTRHRHANTLPSSYGSYRFLLTLFT